MKPGIRAVGVRCVPLALALAAVAGDAAVAAAQRVPTLERVSTFGCADCSGPLQFSAIADLAVSAGATVWVADRDAPMIRAFTTSGQPVRSFGVRGQGPGEFVSIAKLFPALDGTIAVVDMRTFRLTRVDTTGRYISGTPLGGFPFDASAAPGSAVVFVLSSRFQPGTGRILRAVPGADSLQLALGPLADFPSREAVGEVRSVAVAPDSSIAVAEGNQEYRIRVYRPNGTWRDATRAIPRPVRTPAEMQAAQQRARGNAARVVAEAGRGGAAGPVPAPDVPREKPHLNWGGLRYDSRGRLWVKTMRGGEADTVFDVFDRSLAFLGEVTVAGAVSAFSFGADYLATAAPGADDTPQITVWRVTG